jgi:hypothetical protein
MGLLDLVKALDFFGQSFSFNFKGKDAMKTIGGSLTSLLFLVVFIGASYLSLIKFFDRSSPNVQSITTEKDPADRLVMNEVHPIIPLYIVFEVDPTKPPDINPRTRNNMTDPLKKFDFELNIVNSSTSANDFTGAFYGIMCRDLKKKEGAFYYPQFIRMSDEERQQVEDFGICFDTGKDLYMFNDGTWKNSLYLNIRHCHRRPDCDQEDKPLPFYVFTQLKAKAVVNLTDYKEPTYYKYDGQRNTLVEGTFLNQFELVTKERISHIYEVHDKAIIFDGIKKKGEASITELIYQTNTRPTIKLLSDPAYMKCIGDNSYRPFNQLSFNPAVCQAKSNFYCDEDIKKLNGDCNIAMHLDFTFDPYSDTSKTVYEREYISIIGILGEVGGMYSLFFEIFGYFNAILVYFLEKSRVVGVFFPALFAKSTSTKKKIKKLKQHAMDYVEDCLDIHNFIYEISFLRLLMSILFDSAQKDLVLLSGLQMFIKEEQESENEESKRESTKPDKESLKKRMTLKRSKSKKEKMFIQAEAYKKLKSRLRTPSDKDIFKEQESTTVEALITLLKKMFDQKICSNIDSLDLKQLIRDIGQDTVQFVSMASIAVFDSKELEPMRQRTNLEDQQVNIEQEARFEGHDAFIPNEPRISEIKNGPLKRTSTK